MGVSLFLELGKKILFNKYTIIAAIAASMYAVGYYKGSASVKHQQETQAVQEAAETVVVQEQLEVNHDKRVRKILTSPIVDSVASRMLNTWPDKEANAGTP